MELTQKVSDIYPDDECYTVAELAKELDLKPQRTLQIIKEAIASRFVTNLIKRKANRILIPDPMATAISDYYHVRVLKKPKTVPRLVNAAHVFKVPLFDQELSNVAFATFGSEEAIVEHLKSRLEAELKPALVELQAFDAKMQEEKKRLLKKVVSAQHIPVEFNF